MYFTTKFRFVNTFLFIVRFAAEAVGSNSRILNTLSAQYSYMQNGRVILFAIDIGASSG